MVVLRGTLSALTAYPKIQIYLNKTHAQTVRHANGGGEPNTTRRLDATFAVTVASKGYAQTDESTAIQGRQSASIGDGQSESTQVGVASRGLQRSTLSTASPSQPNKLVTSQALCTESRRRVFATNMAAAVASLLILPPSSRYASRSDELGT